MNKKLLYEGKGKKVFAGPEESQVVIEFKDSLTAFNAQKTGSFPHKGKLNCSISNLLLGEIAKHGIATHFLKSLSETEILAKKVEIVPLEVVVRNTIAGSLAKKLGVAEGKDLALPLVEFYYKNDALQDPFLSSEQVLMMEIATREDLDFLEMEALKINEILMNVFSHCGLKLVDFKVEFGRTSSGNLILADEISPDCCRLWDKKSGEKMDKDRFRRDLGGVDMAYTEVWNRLEVWHKQNVLHHKFGVRILPRDVILDTQGRAVFAALKENKTYGNLQQCRVGRYVEMEVKGDASSAFSVVKLAAEKMLHNPLIEKFEITKLS